MLLSAHLVARPHGHSAVPVHHPSVLARRPTPLYLWGHARLRSRPPRAGVAGPRVAAVVLLPAPSGTAGHVGVIVSMLYGWCHGYQGCSATARNSAGHGVRGDSNGKQVQVMRRWLDSRRVSRNDATMVGTRSMVHACCCFSQGVYVVAYLGAGPIGALCLHHCAQLGEGLQVVREARRLALLCVQSSVRQGTAMDACRVFTSTTYVGRSVHCQ